jgi:hypothetical protein
MLGHGVPGQKQGGFEFTRVCVSSPGGGVAAVAGLLPCMCLVRLADGSARVGV